jgi:hypothetical protein
VNRTREKNSSLAINHDCLSIISHTTLDQLRTSQKHNQKYQTTQLVSWVSSHFSCFPSPPSSIHLSSQRMKAERERERERKEKGKGFCCCGLLGLLWSHYCFRNHNFTGFRHSAFSRTVYIYRERDTHTSTNYKLYMQCVYTAGCFTYSSHASRVIISAWLWATKK